MASSSLLDVPRSLLETVTHQQRPRRNANEVVDHALRFIQALERELELDLETSGLSPAERQQLANENIRQIVERLLERLDEGTWA